MTYIATLTTTEAAARALADVVDADERLPSHSIDASEIAPGRWEVVVYLAEKPGRTMRAALADVAAATLGRDAPAFAIRQLAHEDWVAKSLEGLSAVRAGRFLVHGRHQRDRRRENDVAIEIEAGQAFGTGHHGTTAGCLAEVDRLAKCRRFKRPLDLGTGSGVLAIAMAKVLHVTVLASDIDPVAVAVARANARQNGAAGCTRFVATPGMDAAVFSACGPFDLIVANILAGPLVALAPAIRRHTAPGGVVILSGLLAEQRARIVSAYRRQGLVPVAARLLDGWLTLTFRRPGRTGADNRMSGCPPPDLPLSGGGAQIAPVATPRRRPRQVATSRPWPNQADRPIPSFP